MANLHTYTKLPSDPCLSEEQILAYIDGNLSGAEQYACEKHMADCAMCEDALEGLALVKDRTVLVAPLVEDSEPERGKVVPLHQANRKVWYSVAAVLVLVLGSAMLFKIMSSDDAESSDMAYQQEMTYDSLTSAPGEGYATLEKELEDKTQGDQKSLDNVARKDATSEEKPDYFRSITEGDGPVVTVDPVASMDEDYEESVDGNERIVPGYGDREDDVVIEEQSKIVAAETKDQPQPEDDKKEEAEKRNNLFDFATGIATGGTKRAETAQKSKQDAYVGKDRDLATPNAPATNNTSGTVVNSGAETPKITLSGNTGTVDIAQGDTTGHILSEEVTMVNAQDSVAVVDQLELSYQNGLNLMKAGQSNNAIVMFDKVLTNKNHARYEDAELQKAKALIKANKKEEAKTLLKTIEAKKGKHASEATELLNGL